MSDQENAIVLMGQLFGKFYKQITQQLTREDIKAINDQAQKEYENTLGDQITSGIFSYICPETTVLVVSDGFDVHGNINPETNEIEAILTVACTACKKEHPVTIISFPKMMSMPELSELDDKT